MGVGRCRADDGLLRSGDCLFGLVPRNQISSPHRRLSTGQGTGQKGGPMFQGTTRRALITVAYFVSLFLWITGLSVSAVSAEQLGHPRGPGGHGQRAKHHHARYVSIWYPYSNRYWRYGYWPAYRTFSYYVGPYDTSIGYYQPVIYPPFTIDTGALFGPRAIWDQLGVTRPPIVVQSQPTAVQPAADGQADLVLVRPDNKDQRDIATVVRARARARKLILQGDSLFQAGKFSSALQKYHSAVAAEPTLAESWFRRGFAELALNRYPKAVISIERGLRADPNWPQSPFRLTEIYPNADTITAHQEALSAAALADPDDGGLLFLLGVHLYFDGQQERAIPFFKKTLSLHEHVEAVLPFLPRKNPPDIVAIPNDRAPRGREF